MEAGQGDAQVQFGVENVALFAVGDLQGALAQGRIELSTVGAGGTSVDAGAAGFGSYHESYRALLQTLELVEDM